MFQALEKNYEACNAANQVSRALRESDIEDVAVMMEYSVFTSTNAMMMYRNGIMTLVCSCRNVSFVEY